MTRTYCVVGGGISGLAAAYRIRALAGPAATIKVFDPADRLGGVLRTETLAGQTMDIGAEAFIARRPEVPALLAELGLADRQISPTGVRTTIYSQGRLHPLPAGTVNGIPGSAAALSGLVDAATAARIAAEPERPLHWQPGSDPAVGALVADRFGEDHRYPCRRAHDRGGTGRRGRQPDRGGAACSAIGDRGAGLRRCRRRLPGAPR